MSRHRPSDRPDVSFVTSGHDVADARLHRLVDACRRGGLSVEVLGLGNPADGPEGCPVVTRPRRGPVGRAVTGLDLTRRARGRVIVALDPEALLAAAVLGRIRGRRVVADVHEDYARLLRDRSWARGWRLRVAAALVGAATSAAQRADATFVADEHVPPLGAERRLVVRNVADHGHVGAPAELDPSPRAVYVGDLRRSRGLFEMVEALTRCPEWSLDLVGPVAPSDRPRLSGLLQDRRLAGRVRLHGRLPPRRAWSVARGAWVGLALLHDTPAFRDALPTKIGEYVAAGIIPVVTDLPRQRELLERIGAGAVVADVDGVVASLRRLSEESVRTAERARLLAWSERDPARLGGYDEAVAVLRSLAERSEAGARTEVG